MDLCGEFLTHKEFGRGQIVDFANDCVTVLFIDTNEKKRFIYPNAFGRFLILENDQLVKQIQEYKNDIAQSLATAQNDIENSKSLEKKKRPKTVKKAVQKTKK